MQENIDKSENRRRFDPPAFLMGAAVPEMRAIDPRIFQPKYAWKSLMQRQQPLCRNQRSDVTE